MSQDSPNKTYHYEAKVALVETIIEQIESGTIPLEEVFDQFAIAVKNLKQCEAFLNQGRKQMELLIETLED
ncbi:MAG: exodeoxyribonuclease VII small subunit [Chroococcales cyanobacterium]